MTRLTLILTSLVWHMPALAGVDPPLGPPNVILVVTDDQGYGDLACHGNSLLKTPSLDRLREASVTLEDYHVDPVCTPTRAALMTGRYCGRTGAWNVVHGRQLLHTREVTMAEVFRDSGYVTAMFGKWHLGDPWPYDPGSRGFEEVVCCRAGGVDEIGNPIGNDYFDDVYYHNGIPEKYEGYCTDVFFQEAERFIRHASKNDNRRPFFIYLPTNAMHSPFGVPEKYAKRFREEGLPENRARFYGMIENFDENLGRLLSVLDETEQAENTILIFMGDNGTAANSGSEGAFNAGMRGDKGSVYEGGHRVACFVSWPAMLMKHRSVDRLTCHRDWLPTLIEMCDLKSPQNVTFDGRSIVPLLYGKADDWPDRMLVVERQGTQPVMALSTRRPRLLPYAVMTERWRLVNGELYDIDVDPSQRADIAEHNPEVTEALESHYRVYYTDVFSRADDDACFVVGSSTSPDTVFTVRDWRPTRGNVIWEMKQLEQDKLFIQGYWPLEVATSGDYQIEFSRFPFEQAKPMGSDEARLLIGQITQVKQIEPTAASVSFHVRLSAGKTRLEGKLRDASTQKDRGPYYVRVRRVSESE